MNDTKISTMRTFNIQYHSKETKVEQQEEALYIVQLPERTIHLRMRQDNEGANHWFEENHDNETPETKAIGQAIESYLAEENG